jgi:hypothetical protein
MWNDKTLGKTLLQNGGSAQPICSQITDKKRSFKHFFDSTQKDIFAFPSATIQQEQRFAKPLAWRGVGVKAFKGAVMWGRMRSKAR